MIECDVATGKAVTAAMDCPSSGRSCRHLHHFFEATCDDRPEAIALSSPRGKLTYAALDAEANRLAHFLRHRLGGRPGRVGILLDRSFRTYAALLGVLKSGAAFVPLDVSFPAERNAFIAQDSDLRAVLTTSDLLPKLEHLPCPAIALDQVEAAVSACPSRRLEDVPAGGDDDLCYILYTSGTTGRPKGVAISQRSICNLLTVVRDIYGYRPGDRVYQGMTISFDFALEEIWSTFIAGATLVPGPTDGNCVGAGLAQFLIDRQVTVLCCVPTLLSTIDRDLPAVRLLMVGGEACPQDLVCRWSRPGRRILNTYGPTETTITATWTELSPSRPVTIGRPLPTYYVHIVDPQTLRLVAPGQSGEILIGGPGVAIGYVNRPELTREKFVPGPCAHEHPNNGRMYRTGDLGRIVADGEIEFLGRIDTQVKVRGYRIELSEIEAILREFGQVENVVASPWPPGGPVQDLVAYVKPRGGLQLDVTPLHQTLCRRLPPYMVPAYIELVDELPVLPSGKADRSRLRPPRSRRLGLPGKAYAAPAGPLESTIAQAWAEVFTLDRVSAEDDFFLDLAGHSLLAAQVVSTLRRDGRMSNLGVGDLYACPTVRQLAAHVEAHAPRPAEPQAQPARADDADARASRSPWPCAAGQAAAIYFLLAVAGLPALLMLRLWSSQWAADHWAQAMVRSLAAWLLWIVLMALLPVVVKWLVLGRTRNGVYPLWGAYFLRWWIVRKVMGLAPLGLLVGTPLLNLYLRLLGAKIGRDCYLGTAHVPVPDMVSIGPGASVGYGTQLVGCEVRDGLLRIAPLTVGADCCVGSNCVLMPGSSMGPSARLGDQSLLAGGQSIPDGATWRGSPARPTGPDAAVETLASLPACSPGPAMRAVWTLAFALAGILPALVPAAAAIPGVMLLVWAQQTLGLGAMLACCLPAALSFVLCLCGLIAGLKQLLLRSPRAGIYPLWSLFHLRKWLVDVLVGMSLTTLQALYATLYLPPWLRLLGARIGRRTEISTASHITPNLLRIDDESFVADAACAGPARVYRGHLLLAPTHIGRRSFLGNSAFMPAGASLSDNCLVGALSVPPIRPPKPGTSWLGSPAIFLPHRQPSATFEESQTFSPTPGLLAQRYAYEFFRVTGPPALWFACGSLVIWALSAILAAAPLWAAGCAFPLLYLASASLACAVVVAVKWIVIGRYRPMVRPLWCHFTRRTELVTGLYENVTVPMLLSLFSGSPFAAPVLQALGVRIGRRVFLETTYLTEFDLVDVADDAQVASTASLQTHLFEDRVMKTSHVRVGRGCSIGPRAIVLYDSVMEDGACLEALSLLMKGETLPAGTRWWGSPSRPRSR